MRTEQLSLNTTRVSSRFDFNIVWIYLLALLAVVSTVITLLSMKAFCSCSITGCRLKFFGLICLTYENYRSTEITIEHVCDKMNTDTLLYSAGRRC